MNSGCWFAYTILLDKDSDFLDSAKKGYNTFCYDDIEWAMHRDNNKIGETIGLLNKIGLISFSQPPTVEITTLDSASDLLKKVEEGKKYRIVQSAFEMRTIIYFYDYIYYISHYRIHSEKTMMDLFKYLETKQSEFL